MTLFNRRKDDPMAAGVEELEDVEPTEEELAAEAKAIEYEHRVQALEYSLALSQGLTTSGAQIVKDAKTIQKYLWDD